MFMRRKHSSSPNQQQPQHPFSAPPPQPDYMLSNLQSDEDDEQCPVCLESLSLRLAGEKPHIVPQCGHKLHEACFEAVYGNVQNARRSQMSLGLCGVCRRDMKIGDPSDHRSKFAALSGQPSLGSSPSPATSHKLRSITKKTIPRDGRPALHDPNEDDDILPQFYQSQQSSSSNGESLYPSSSRYGQYSTAQTPIPPIQVTQPRITINSETSSVTRPQSNNKDSVTHLTCMVSVEMPSKTPDAKNAALSNYDRGAPIQSPPAFTASSLPPIPPQAMQHSISANGSSSSNSGSSASGNGAASADDQQQRSYDGSPVMVSHNPASSSDSAVTANIHHQQQQQQVNGGDHVVPFPSSSPPQPVYSQSPSTNSVQTLSPVPNSYDFPTPAGGSSIGLPPTDVPTSPDQSKDFPLHDSYESNQITGNNENENNTNNSAFTAAFNDLIARMSDWKGHSPNDFGPLKLYDYLYVRKEKAVREFLVYLFEDALLCVSDDKRKGFGKFVDSPNKLRLKGRVYIRHIKRVEDQDMNLVIYMEDDALDTFVISFNDNQSLRVWKAQIDALIREQLRRKNGESSTPTPTAPTAPNPISSTPPQQQHQQFTYKSPSATVHSLPSIDERSAATGFSSPSQQMVRPQRSQSSFRGSVLSEDTYLTRSTTTTTTTSRTISSTDTNFTRANTVSTAPTSYTSSNHHSDKLHDYYGHPRPHKERSVEDDASYYTTSHNRSGSMSTVDTRRTQSSTGHAHSTMTANTSASGSRPYYAHHKPSPTHSSGNSVHTVKASTSPLKDCTAIDLILILSVPSSRTYAPETKLRLLRSTVEFVAHHLSPGSRLSVVTYSSGVSTKIDPESGTGVLKKTSFLSVDKASSKARLERIVQTLGDDDDVSQSYYNNIYDESSSSFNNYSNNSLDANHWTHVDPKEEKINVATAVNLALDIVLQRHQKAPVTGMILVNDGKDNTQKQQMDLIMARADAARVPIHCFGWGKTHDPSSLWLLSNHTNGSYTYIREWTHLKECLSGCVGGLLSIGTTHLSLHISVPDKRWFRIRKVAGVPNAILATSGTDVDIDIGEIRYGEKREMLVEVEMRDYDNIENGEDHSNGDQDDDRLDLQSLRSGKSSVSAPGIGNGHNQAGHPYYSGPQKRLSRPPKSQFRSATDEFFIRSTGLNPLSLDDPDFYEEEQESTIEEFPLLEAQASFTDPIAGKKVSRLPAPVLYTVTVIPEQHNNEDPASNRSDPSIVRRRMECLTADMFLRALLLMSRSNYSQAYRLLTETKRILSTIVQSLPGMMPQGSNTNSARAVVHSVNIANSVLSACSEDVETLLEGLQHYRNNPSSGSSTPNSSNSSGIQQPLDIPSLKNFATQQAICLRDQHAWTPRTLTERCYWNSDSSIYLIGESQQWVGNY